MKTDYLVFGLGLVALFALLELWMWRSGTKAGLSAEDRHTVRGTLPVLMTALLVALLFLGWVFVEQAERKERERIEKIVQGVAPTLAYELGTEGHARIHLATAPDDPHYLKQIEHMRDWMRLNPQVESIYTMRRQPDGSTVFILGPETDYDRNGVIEGEEEQRVPIGEKYNEVIPELEQAFKGLNKIQQAPTQDKWGYSISAFVPIFSRQGRQEAVLGVDFNGAAWVMGIRFARLSVMGIITVFFVLMNATYLIVFGYRGEALRIRRHQAELAKSKEAADTANKAKSEFLSRMSHDLRTPLNAVSGFAQLLESDPSLAETHRRMVQEILSAGDHLLKLINEVLDLSRIEAGRVSLTFEFVPLCSIIGNCLSMITPLAAQRGISISRQIEECEGYLVYADATRLQEVVLNLLSNAVKYNSDAGVITITSRPVEDGFLRVSVADTGAGIPEEDLKDLFQLFSRLEGHKDIEGTGIGLAVVKKIVELMGGRVGVTSTVGEGSCFWVELPCIEGTADVATGMMKERALPALSGADRQYRVLYVEDTPANVALMAQIFSRFPSVSLHSAATGRLALEMAQAECPDLILADINLPDFDGFELLRQLRHLEAAQDIPVIAVGSSARLEDVQRGAAKGFARYLTKPINVAEFLAAVDAVLDAR